MLTVCMNRLSVREGQDAAPLLPVAESGCEGEHNTCCHARCVPFLDVRVCVRLCVIHVYTQTLISNGAFRHFGCIFFYTPFAPLIR